MNKKIIIGLVIAAVIGISFLAYKKYAKKPCPCSANQTPEQAIDKMSDTDLKEQIKGLNDKIELVGKTSDQLKKILKDLIK